MTYLKPSDLKEIPLYNDWESMEEIIINNCKIKRQKGSIQQEGNDNQLLCNFSKLLQIATLNEVSEILNLVKSATFDIDPDSVDGITSYEFYIKSPDLTKNSKYNNNDLNTSQIRNKLQKIIDPIINDRITPYLRTIYPNKKKRECTACYCFIRRYKQEERVTHPTHRDGHAFATVVISLSDYETDYRGGIYVATAERYKSYIALNKGDAIVHKHDLLHGVKVKKDGGERWSLIIWFKDSKKCIDYSNEWYKEKANNGEAVYQSLYANHVGANDIILWHKKAADKGFSNSMVKLARAYLKRLPSNLEYNPKEAEKYYRLAIKTSQDPQAQYGLADMILSGLIEIETNSMVDKLKIVINLLEESAKGGDSFAMFNLGIAHFYGYSGKIDRELSKDWFIESNLPEGLYIASLYYVNNNIKIADELKIKAKKLGFGTNWRKMARERTGIGGAGGVDINLCWPNLSNNKRPINL